eukprot:gene15480-18695_t
MCLALPCLSQLAPTAERAQGHRRLPDGTAFFYERYVLMSDPLAWVNGSDAPEKSSLNLGFMALSDCASVVVAATQGFAQPYGLTLNLRRQSSWASLRDNLVSGELDAAHSLYGLIYAVHLGIGGTFPTGTHAMWLYYWLASQGIHPLQDVDSVVVPPPQMVAHLQAGRIDGFCVGEPWCASAVKQNQGFTLATTQALWPDHPEKVLGCTQAFVEQYPNTARVLVMAILQASRFIEQSTENRRSTAQLLSAPQYLDAPLDCIEPRLLGDYDDGLGNHWQDPHALRFYGDGEVNLPYLSDGMWFMTQFRRWGLLREDPDYLGVARRVQQLDIYRQAASAVGVPAGGEAMRSSQLIDGKIWDGSDPAGYARSFRLHAMADVASRQALR